MAATLQDQKTYLKTAYNHAVRQGEKPALVFDADDTTLWTYDMEVADMHFNFDPARQDVWVQEQRFPATPGMVELRQHGRSDGVHGLRAHRPQRQPEGRHGGNLAKVGLHRLPGGPLLHEVDRLGTQQPAYITCAAAKCTTVEYKAGTRKHIEDLGYDIVLNVGDQWSDLQGGYADRTLKLPNPTYYLPSPTCPGCEPWLAPRTHFTMKPDGSSGLTESGEGIPNIDSVKKTIAAYYGDPGTGIATRAPRRTSREMQRSASKQHAAIVRPARPAARQGTKPAVVFDADDTTLWTYDMEVADMHFNFDPAVQDVWVQDERFPATPGMVGLVKAAARRRLHASSASPAATTTSGRRPWGTCTRSATPAFTEANYYTKWTERTTQQPAYITCAAREVHARSSTSRRPAGTSSRSGRRMTSSPTSVTSSATSSAATPTTR